MASSGVNFHLFHVPFTLLSPSIWPLFRLCESTSSLIGNELDRISKEGAGEWLQTTPNRLTMQSLRQQSTFNIKDRMQHFLPLRYQGTLLRDPIFDL